MNRPRVSVGLAVYNGEAYLPMALDSILAQSFNAFELIISDNASTDGTKSICTEYAAADSRIRYSRNPVNIGGVRNENRTFYLARGEFFKLAAHDDLISADFLEACVEKMDADPGIELCVPAVEVIDGAGQPLAIDAIVAGLEPTAPQRLRAMLNWGYMCEGSYGLFRTAALRLVRPQTNRAHSDRVVLGELAMRRPFVFAERAVISKRVHQANTCSDWSSRMAWYQPELKSTGSIRLPHWHHLCDLAAMVARSQLPRTERLLCAAEIGRWVYHRRRDLSMDGLVASRMLIAGRASRLHRYQSEGR